MAALLFGPNAGRRTGFLPYIANQPLNCCHRIALDALTRRVHDWRRLAGLPRGGGDPRLMCECAPERLLLEAKWGGCEAQALEPRFDATELSKRSCFRQRMPLCFTVPSSGTHACLGSKAGRVTLKCSVSSCWYCPRQDPWPPASGANLTFESRLPGVRSQMSNSKAPLDS